LGVLVGSEVLFVCPHGAGKSRIAAAWFGAIAPAGWTATTAGIEPQASVSVHAPRLLAETPALAFLDQEMPRSLSAVPSAALIVAIDCPVGAVPGAVAWELTHSEFSEELAAELRRRVLDLVGSLDAVAGGRDGESGG
jgi:hypothetical protein